MSSDIKESLELVVGCFMLVNFHSVPDSLDDSGSLGSYFSFQYLNKMNVVHFPAVLVEYVKYQLRLRRSDINSMFFYNFLEIINVYIALLIDVNFFKRLFEE